MGDVDRLKAILREEEQLTAVLSALARLQAPDGCVGAGCLAQCVWNRLTGRPGMAGVADIDVAYFDSSDLEGAGEGALEAALDRARGGIGPPLDVKNQARVHLWYAARFGRPIAPYPSIYAAIGSWPTTATAMTVRLRDGKLEVFAPFGLDDLFDMVVRPNKALVTRRVYEAKAGRWLECWPELTIMPW